MTKKCDVCGNTNGDEVSFCDSCGTPLEDTQVEENKFSEIMLGYASNVREQPEGSDSFFVINTTASFGEIKHHRILCVIIKGLGKDVDVKVITQELLDTMLRNQGEIEYAPLLLEIQNKLKKDFSDLFLVDTNEKPKTGLLIGAIDNAQVNVLQIGSPKVIVLKCSNKTIINECKEELLSLELENNDYICMSSTNFSEYIEDNEFIEIISGTESPQTVCENIIEKVKTDNTVADPSLAIVLLKKGSFYR